MDSRLEAMDRRLQGLSVRLSDRQHAVASDSEGAV